MIEEAVTLRPAWAIWQPFIRGCYQWWLRCTPARRHKKLLVIAESVPLGEKRALVLAQFGKERFLIGVTGSSIVLLSKLPAIDFTD